MFENAILPESTMAFVHAVLSREDLPEVCCQRCGPEFVALARAQYNKELPVVMKDLQRKLSIVPIISVHQPLDWDYQICELVTAQTTTGTSILSELSASFADFFGAQSDVYNRKLRDGENLCKAALRKEAVQMGANAVIGVDIDYAEVGGAKGMVMVCMSGTAVRLRNPEVVSPDLSQQIQELEILWERHRQLTQYVKLAEVR